MAVANSTISDNTATYGGGVLIDSSPVSIRNSTSSGNSASNTGGGIYNFTSSTVTSLANTIVAGDSAPQSSAGPDCYGALTSVGFNILGTSGGSAGLVDGANGDHVGAPGTPLTPGLGSLQDNEGPTWTMAVLPASPALDAGIRRLFRHPGRSSCDRSTGAPRPYPAGGRCDIGAYEFGALSPTSTPPPTPTTTATPAPTPTTATTTLTLSLQPGWNLIALPISPTLPVQAHTVVSTVVTSSGGGIAEMATWTGSGWTTALNTGGQSWATTLRQSWIRAISCIPTNQTS